MAISLSQDSNVMAAIKDATDAWKGQAGPHQAVNKEVRDEHHEKVLVHIDSRGRFSAQRVKSFKEAEKLAKQGDDALGQMLAEAKAHPGEPLHRNLKVGGQKYLATLHANGQFEVQKVNHWDEGRALTDALDRLAAQMTALPPSARHALTEKVKVGKNNEWQVTLNPDGTVGEKQTKKPHHGGLFGGLLKIVSKIAPIANIAALVFPPLVPVAAGLTLATSVDKAAHGDILGGLIGAAGGAAGLGVGGTFLKTATTLAKGTELTIGAVKNGNLFGIVEGVAGAVGNVAGGAVAQVADTVGKDVKAVEGAIGAVRSGNVLDAVRGVSGAVGQIAGGDVARVADTIGKDTAAVEGAVTTIHGGNVLGVIGGVSGAVGQVAGGSVKDTTDKIVRVAGDAEKVENAVTSIGKGGGIAGLVQTGRSIGGAVGAGQDIAKTVGF